MSGRLRVAVDRDACCGSGNCVRTAPEVFDQDADLGLVVLRQAEPPESEYDAVREAAYNCPAAAIDLTEP
ncbi:ferredoxin [Catellatospora citrea]|uniref:Ferredoxin n=1 Tax=Catellatospora citrea TaxID=53366 RepID=A0A8J3P0P5_9ACTN|nr:ferredoxin [Catellatospora citrea]RKE02690.1 ferredoxin [Catellatospora citrea]GIF99522.1 ferredoxin [Catellatospora citrea]